MKTIAILLMLLPLVFISMIYYEGGLAGLAMFGLYIFATLCTLVAPFAGLLLYKGSNYLK
jgi:hypothetical protein